VTPSGNPAPAPVRARRGRPRKPRELELGITLAGIEPPIWRSVRVPDAYTLDQLHRVIQLVFGWLDYHLYDFSIGGRRFEEPHPEAEGEDSTAVTLYDLALKPGATFTYVYDFGDGWRHDIVVDDAFSVLREPDELRLPVLRGGARAGPPEDAGGPHEYMLKLDALRDRKHPEHTDVRRWLGPDYDPERFDSRMAANNLTLAAAWGAI
jgi:hypothetical protein